MSIRIRNVECTRRSAFGSRKVIHSRSEVRGPRSGGPGREVSDRSGIIPSFPRRPCPAYPELVREKPGRESSFPCHSRAGGNPVHRSWWIPAFAGMTTCLLGDDSGHAASRRCRDLACPYGLRTLDLRPSDVRPSTFDVFPLSPHDHTKPRIRVYLSSLSSSALAAARNRHYTTCSIWPTLPTI